MTHQDANITVNVHSGTIMKLIDNTARIVAARYTGKTPITASAHLTFAALDENGRPRPSPPILCETEDEKRRRREAQERRARRLRCRKE